ncbi:uncharacterized protein KY384_000220 [Bacidia gigantensis]|uniref:uncharacterized protein n=1 Tax=Bacidia gigantensis TaxID=2732470 RepID=UPI001D0584FE|nr:uncharacterized protein KY384_000220 [Bacidia gigantensis]KAG8526227.1 hypothetical protein KY384_000220 [Bacidia gigantensis]
MTDLLTILPSFPNAQYSHLLPSLEKNLITTTDLLTLDSLEVARRAQLPLLDLKRLISHVLLSLQSELGVQSAQHGEGLGKKFEDVRQRGEKGWGRLRTDGTSLLKKTWETISLGNEKLDDIVGGGIPTGYITEFVGESGAAKTQILLFLLLAVQLPPSQGLSRSALYISTEHALPTPRLTQLINSHPLFTSLPPSTRPTLSNILSISTSDLETQDHILQYQVPVALARHNIGLVVIDSIAANYRAEKTVSSSTSSAEKQRLESLSRRNTQLVRLGSLLRNLAREHNCAIVVANQVSDRFAPTPQPIATGPSSSARAGLGTQRSSGPYSSSPAFPTQPPSEPWGLPSVATVPTVQSLNHQMRWFTGWGDSPSKSAEVGKGDKTPALGLAWANQIACRVAVIKEANFVRGGGPKLGSAMGREDDEVDWAPRRWRRYMKLVFAPWAEPTRGEEKGVEFEVCAEGVRAV